MFSKQFYVYFVAFVASLGGFQFGYEVGILESIKTIESFKKDFSSNEYIDIDNYYQLTYKEDETKNTLTQITFCIGCMIGALIVPFIGDFFGRKRSIIVGASFFGLGSIIAGVTTTIQLFYFARVVIGLGIGILSTVCPLYISETAPINIRGRLLVIYQLMITIGIFVAYLVKIVIEYFLKNDPGVQWRATLGVQVVPGILLLIMMFFLPYSPRYLLWQERDEDALRVIAKLRGVSSTHDHEMQIEFQNMKKKLEIERHENSMGWCELFKGSLLKRVFLIMMLQFLQQLTGINVILYNQYSLIDRIFNGNNSTANILGSTSSKSVTVGAAINVLVNVIGTLPTLKVVDKYGRKKTLIAGCIAMMVSYTGCAFFMSYNDYNSVIDGLKLIFIYLFVLSFAFSWGPVIWVYQSEIFPMRVRTKGTAIGSFSNWFSFALIAIIAPLLFNRFKDHIYYVYIIFDIWCFIALVFTIIFVKETKDLALEDIDNVFENKDKNKQR